MERHVETVHAPEIFGELWLLTQMHANVKIVACKPSEVFVLNREKLMALLSLKPELAMQLYKHFTQRLVSRFLTRQNTNQKKTA
jgi:CRP-like cAMP-binding protein